MKFTTTKMYSRIFGLKESDDIDEIFNLDDLDPPQINESQNIANIQPTNQSGFLSALQTPQITENPRPPILDSALGTLSDVLIDECFQNDDFEVSYGHLDSAVGTGSQSTGSYQSFADEISVASFESQRISMREPSEADMFSQDIQMDGISNDHFILSNAFGSSIRNVDNFVGSFNSTLPSTPGSSTGGAALSELSFYSLLRRGIMRANLHQSGSSVPLSLQSSRVTQVRSTQSESTSQFFNGQSISASFPGASFNGLNVENHFPADRSTSFEIEQLSPFTTPPSQALFEERASKLQEGNYFDSQETQISSKLPESILNLHEEIKGSGLSDWSFVYALSAQTCQEFLPMNYNVTLKTSLLLSIASIDTVSGIV